MPINLQLLIYSTDNLAENTVSFVTTEWTSLAMLNILKAILCIYIIQYG